MDIVWILFDVYVWRSIFNSGSIIQNEPPSPSPPNEGCNEAVVVSWWEIFTRNGGKPGMEWVRGGGGYNRGMGNF